MKIRAVALVFLVALSIGVVGVGADGTQVIALTQEVILTPEPGEIDVVLRFEIPEAVTALSTRVPTDATVTETDGFREDDGTYVWDGSTQTPSLTYTVPANRTHGHGLIFADFGTWGLVERPQTPVQWQWVGAEWVRLDRTTVATPGITGSNSAFLGDYVADSRSIGDETVTLVVPAAASLAESPDDVHATLVDAARALRVGGQNDETFVVAAPSGEWWGVRGLQFGETDIWVSDDSRFDADNVWVHEYVHTRQVYSTNEEVRWFTEASAVYYAALLTLERGDIGFEAFSDRLAHGEHSSHADDVLADPGTWTGNPNYHKGALVAADLDRRIRLATDGERDLQDVFRAMNDHDGQVRQEDFLRFVEEAGGPEVRETARRYTETPDGPTMWDEREHRQAFSLVAPRIGYRFDGDAHVAGPYRDRPVEEPITLVSGERLTANATVENTGGEASDYEAALRVNGDVERTVGGRLDPGERESITVDRRFDEPGEYDLRIGDASLAVRVVEPAEATVTGLNPSHATVGTGEEIEATATVENGADRPGVAELDLVVDGDVRDSRTVHLDAGETRTVTFTTTFDEPGEYDLRVGDERTSVTVERSVRSPQPGFGATVATVAVSLLLLIESLRRGRTRR